jgi:hypothetical protein
MGGSVALALALHPDDVWICSNLLQFCHGEFTALGIVVEQRDVAAVPAYRDIP